MAQMETISFNSLISGIIEKAFNKNMEDPSGISSGLKKCFLALIEGKTVSIEKQVLDLIIEKEVNPQDEYSGEMVEILPQMLVYYIQTWPGWKKSSEFHEGKLTFKEWFEKFKTYLLLKTSMLCKNGYNEAKNEALQQLKKKKSKGNFAEKGSMTDNLHPKGYAPFTIELTCEPEVLNTVVFTRNDNDIELKFYPCQTWVNISIKQLINWSNVEVIFKSKNLEFYRKNCTEVKRYVSLTNCQLKNSQNQFIDMVDEIDPSLPHEIYSFEYIQMYAQSLFHTLSKVQNDLSESVYFSDISLNVQDIKTVLEEFLFDIVDVDINNKSIATNHKVSFNIGKSTFVRVRKLKGSNSEPSMEIGYCEYIVPRIEFGLIKFDAETEPVPEGFKNLSEMRQKVGLFDSTIEDDLPKLIFRCTFCNMSFENKKLIFSHLEELHKNEQSLVCYRCKVSNSLHTLTDNRWNHACTGDTIKKRAS